jgi:hypothetical protein
MGQSTLLEIETYKKKIAALQKRAAKEQKKLLQLPAKFGFKTVGDFVDAVKAAAKAAGSGSRDVKVSGGKRAKITPETKAKVKALAEEGKTAAEIASVAGISVPSVANIKKELGLVKKRK